MTIISTYFLRTKRLGFRFWSLTDFELALGLWGDLRVTNHIDSRGHLNEIQVKERLKQEISTAELYGVQYWPIFLLSNNDHVGCCGLHPYDLPNGLFEIGFHICSKHWKKGYAYESATAIIKYAFCELKVTGLFAGHNPKNDVSQKLLNKLDFHYIHDEYYKQTGLFHPSYILSADRYLK